MEESILDPVPEFKLYNETAVRGATFFGGPLVAGYLIAENFKLLDHPEKARVTWICAIAVTIVLSAAIFLVPAIQNIPQYVIPIVYAVIASLIVQQTQGDEIEKHIKTGGQLFSFWRIAFISLIGLIITGAILTVLVLVTEKQFL